MAGISFCGVSNGWQICMRTRTAAANARQSLYAYVSTYDPTFVLVLSRRSRIRARIGYHRTLFVYTRECMLCEPTPVIQCLDRSMRRHSTIADIAYCLYHTRRCAYTRTYTTCTFLFSIQSLISNACHSLCRVTRGFNILCQIMVTFLSYISNACHFLSGVAERLQHT